MDTRQPSLNRAKKSWSCGRTVCRGAATSIAQQSVPSLVRSAAQPELTRSALAAAVLTCCALYLLLGTLAAIVFGGVTSPLITLNLPISPAAPLRA